MSKVFIGTGVTDSNGVAILSKDPNDEDIGGYTGTGAGEVELSASATIDGETIDSQPYTIYDIPLPLSVTLSLSDNDVVFGETVTLTATVTEGGDVVEGGTVTFKRGSTQIGTATTNSSGVATYSYVTDTSGELSITATYDTQTSTASTLTVNKINTSLAITVPQLVYSDVFDITGVLEDSSNNPISGASVKLVWEVNDTQYDATETTDSDGEVNFHRSAPTSIETYDFWLEYDGSDKYVASQSSVENRTVGKETSVLTVTSPLDQTSHIVDGGLLISGTLLSNDAEAMSGKSVVVKESDTTLTTLTTDNNGAFSDTISLPIGSHSLTIEFVADANYTTSSASRTVTMTNTSLTLVSDKSILSYADSESATLTATYVSSDPANKSVMFYSGNPNVTTNDCTSSTDFTIISGSPTFASTGMTVHEDVDKVMLSEDLFDLSEGSYNIRLTCTKPSDSTSWFGGGISLSTGQLDYITGVFVDESDVYFLDSSFTLPSDLDDTINISIELTPSSQRIYINNELVGSTSHDYTEEIGGIKVWSDYNYLNFWKLHDDFEVNNIVVYDSSTTDYLDFGVTDSNGVATATYQSKNAGDIYITATCNNITSSSVLIEDIYDYDPMTSSNNKWDWGTSITPQFSSDGCRITTSSTNYPVATYTGTLPVNYELEAKFKFEQTTNQDAITINTYQCAIYDGNRIGIFNVWPPNYNASCSNFGTGSFVTLKFRVENSVLSIIQGNTTLVSGNVGSTNTLGFTVYKTDSSGRVRTVKDIKIKSL